MPRKLIKRLLPPKETLARHRHLRLLGDWIHDSNLWHLNRDSTSLAMFVGIFVAFLPIPMQMPVAAMGALLFRCNLPLSVALVWITNPLTIPPMFYGAYKLGAVLLNIEPRALQPALSLVWLTQEIATIWKPLLLGSLVCGTVFGAIGFGSIRLIWRIAVVRRWRQRARDRAERARRRAPKSDQAS